MVWRFTGDRPVYQQIKEQIRCAVVSGEFIPGGKFPAVRDLAMDAQVNPNTMQRALRELEQEGLLTTDSTNGRYVTNDPNVLDCIRKQQLELVCTECIRQFTAMGVSSAQAVDILSEFIQREE